MTYLSCSQTKKSHNVRQNASLLPSLKSLEISDSSACWRHRVNTWSVQLSNLFILSCSSKVTIGRQLINYVSIGGEPTRRSFWGARKQIENAIIETEAVNFKL